MTGVRSVWEYRTWSYRDYLARRVTLDFLGQRGWEAYAVEGETHFLRRRVR